MYTIIFNENAGVKDIEHKCDVKLTLVSKCRQGYTVKQVLKDNEDVTAEMIKGLPL